MYGLWDTLYDYGVGLMGIRFRKSIKMGPMRLNLSKSGVGASVGGKGFRVTKKAKGGFRASASVPGTGVGYTKDFGGKKKRSKTAALQNTQRVAQPSTEHSAPVEKATGKPWYKQWWFYAIIAVWLLGAIINTITGGALLS